MYLYLFIPYFLRLSQVRPWLLLGLNEMIRLSDVVACPMVFVFLLWSSLAQKSVQTWSVLSIFGCCHPLHQDFAEVQAQIILCSIKRMYYSYMPNQGVAYVRFFFPIWDFLHNHSRIKGLQGKGEGILLTPRYHFHLLHRHLDIGWGNITGGSPLIRVSHVVALLAVFFCFMGKVGKEEFSAL